MIRFLILILFCNLCYGNEVKNSINDFLNTLHNTKHVSHTKKDFAEFLLQCHKNGVREDFKKGFGSNLNGANFSQLYLNRSIFNGVSLIGADFSNTDLTNLY